MSSPVLRPLDHSPPVALPSLPVVPPLPSLPVVPLRSVASGLLPELAEAEPD